MSDRNNILHPGKKSRLKTDRDSGLFSLAYRIVPSPRLKNVKIVISENGEVILRVPPKIKRLDAESILMKHEQWILRTKKKQEEYTKNNPDPQYQNNDRFPWRGSFVTIKIINGTKNSLSHGNDELIINVNEKTRNYENFNSYYVKSVLETHYRSCARNLLNERLDYYSKKMNIRYNSFRIKNVKSIWGSSSSRGNLNFNLRLIMCPDDVVDYLIVHELAHQVHPDHSRRFHSFVDRYIPDSKNARSWLRANERKLFAYFR